MDGALVLVAALLIMVLIPAAIASGKGRSFALWFFYGLFLFPLAFIHALIIKPNEMAQGMKKCPKCASIIPAIATICPSCRTDFALAGDAPQVSQSDTAVKSVPQKNFEGEMNIASAPYQLYLTRKFAIEKNDTLGKFVIGDDVFDTLEQSLVEADRRNSTQIAADREAFRVDEDKRMSEERTRVAEEERRAKEAELERLRRAEEETRLAPIRAANKRKMAIGFGICLIIAIVLAVLKGNWQKEVQRIRDEEVRIEREVAEKKAAEEKFAREANVAKASAELGEMYSSSSLFGFKIGENNLAQLVDKLKIEPRSDYYGINVRCVESMCSRLTGDTSLASSLFRATFQYCFPPGVKADIGKKETYKHFTLTAVGVSLRLQGLYGTSINEDNSAVTDLLNKPGFLKPWTNIGASQEIKHDFLGVSLIRKAWGKEMLDICGNQKKH